MTGSDFSKTGAIDLIDHKIADQKLDCTGIYLTKTEFLAMSIKTICGMIVVIIGVTGGVIAWSNNTVQNIEQSKGDITLIKNEIVLVKASIESQDEKLDIIIKAID